MSKKRRDLSSPDPKRGEADTADRGERDTPVQQAPRKGNRRGPLSSVAKDDSVGRGTDKPVREDNVPAARTDISGLTEVRENVWGTSGKATDFFKEPSYRQYQKETLESIERLYEGGAKFVIVEAPTGFGKSGIANALAFQSNNAYILTVQKVLQDQYERSYPDMFVMKGRGAFTCLCGDGESCAKGPCRLGQEETHPDCPYRIAKEASMRAPVTVHNFDSFYFGNAFSHGHGYSGRKLIIVDEAHNIENKYLGFMEFSVSSMGTIPQFTDIKKYDEFLTGEHARAVGAAAVLEAARDGRGISPEELDTLETLNRLIHKMDHYFWAREQGGRQNEYVFFHDKTSKGEDRVTFKPLFVGNYVEENLFKYGDRILLMSATILSKELFCAEVGIPVALTKFIRVPSTFPKENRPIIRWYVGSMNRTNIVNNLPKMVEALRVVLKRHPDQRGIIHTHTERIANYIKENLKDARLTFNKDYQTAKDALTAHAGKAASVLVASGLREGIDLSDDLSRFQVFCKVPYPDLGDPRVARKAALDNRWYSYHVALMFVQAYGRSIRHTTDKATTYILDSDFDRFLQSARQFIPQHVLEAIVWQ